MTGPKATGQHDDADMPFVYLDMIDIRSNLTDKHVATIEYVDEKYGDKFDWFLSTHDDTYIAMENLRLFLATKCGDEKRLYGKVMIYNEQLKKVYTHGDNSKGFIQGGSGWLASREAIRLFAQAQRKDPVNFCRWPHGRIGYQEDQEVSDCYRKVDVYSGESHDELNRERFLMNAFQE